MSLSPELINKLVPDIILPKIYDENGKAKSELEIMKLIEETDPDYYYDLAVATAFALMGYGLPKSAKNIGYKLQKNGNMYALNETPRQITSAEADDNLRCFARKKLIERQRSLKMQSSSLSQKIIGELTQIDRIFQRLDTSIQDEDRLTSMFSQDLYTYFKAIYNHNNPENKVGERITYSEIRNMIYTSFIDCSLKQNNDVKSEPMCRFVKGRKK